MKKEINRRDFIKKSTIASLGMAIAPAVPFGSLLKSKARIGLIGVGL
ncbi:MAG: twin-arginine translocation signal domain-containing protein, partial [Caldithrix sp.]